MKLEIIDEHENNANKKFENDLNLVKWFADADKKELDKTKMFDLPDYVHDNISGKESIYSSPWGGSSDETRTKENPWIKDPLNIMKKILQDRVELQKKCENFVKNFENYNQKDFAENFLNLFEFSYSDEEYDYMRKNGIWLNELTDDFYKNSVLSQFKDKSIKHINTNIYDEHLVWGEVDGIYSDKISYDIITDLPVDTKKEYTKEEIANLLKTNKVFVVKHNTEYIDGIDSNVPNGWELEEGILPKNSYDWYKQYISTEFLKKNNTFKKEVFQMVESFKKQTKILSHEIFKTAYNAYQKEKKFLEIEVETHTKKLDESHKNRKAKLLEEYKKEIKWENEKFKENMKKEKQKLKTLEENKKFIENLEKIEKEEMEF